MDASRALVATTRSSRELAQRFAFEATRPDRRPPKPRRTGRYFLSRVASDVAASSAWAAFRGAARCAVSLSLRERRSQFPPQSGARASTCAKTKDRALVHGAAARAVAKRPERGIHVPFAPGSTRKNIRPAKNFLHCTSHARTHARRVLPRIRNASRDRMETSRHRQRHEWRSSGEARADAGRLHASGLYVCLS